MKHRQLGNYKKNVTEIGLGCWQIGSDWGSKISNKSAFAILNEAIANGVRFFDTANVYGDGKSEELIGEFLTTCNEEVIVATKFGRGSSVFPNNYTEEALRQSAKQSMDRLQMKSLDLLQLHCVPKGVLQQGVIFDWLRRAKNDQLIKAFGASVETVDEGLLCLEEEGLTSLQVIVNIFRQKPVHELFSKAKEKNVGIIVRLPLASGLLTGKFDIDTTFAVSDHRNYNKNGEAFNVGETFAGIPFKKGVELANIIERDFLPESLTMSQLALRWLLDHQAVSTIIPGASSPKHIRQNAHCTHLEKLSDKTHNQLAEFYHSTIKKHIRGPY